MRGNFNIISHGTKRTITILSADNLLVGNTSICINNIYQKFN